VLQVCLSIIRPPNVQFPPGDFVLTDESKATLDMVARVMRDHPHIRAEVQGHTDGREPLYGRKLGLKRAEVARQYLIDQGIVADRLCPRGYGATRPLAPNDTSERRAVNRRVELRVLEPDESCSP
jgi:OOP family OmpA-OmpF porin